MTRTYTYILAIDISIPGGLDPLPCREAARPRSLPGPVARRVIPHRGLRLGAFPEFAGSSLSRDGSGLSRYLPNFPARHCAGAFCGVIA